MVQRNDQCDNKFVMRQKLSSYLVFQLATYPPSDKIVLLLGVSTCDISNACDISTLACNKLQLIQV